MNGFAIAFAFSLQLAPGQPVAQVGAQPAAPRDAWFGADKVKHFFVTAFIQSASYGGLRAVKLDHGPSLAGASVTSAVFSVGKEVRDRRLTGLFSKRDLVWDAAGAGTATIMLEHTRR